MENLFEEFDSKEQNVKEINKSEIFSALKYGQNAISFKKSGKSLKEHIKNVLIPALENKINDLNINLQNYLEVNSYPPTQPVYSAILTEEDFPYKVYSWEETEYVEKSIGIFKGFGECFEGCDVCVDAEENPVLAKKHCESLEVAQARKTYNGWVYDLKDALMDLKTANVLINNLDDNIDYYLSLDQLQALQLK